MTIYERIYIRTNITISYYLKNHLIAIKPNKTARKRPLRSIKMSQEAYLTIRVYKTEQTPPFVV